MLCALDANKAADDNERGTRLPYKLEQVLRVQIVCVKNKWENLALRDGFLYVDDKQLVKVGGPVDKACKIKDMLVSLRQAKADLNAQ